MWEEKLSAWHMMWTESYRECLGFLQRWFYMESDCKRLFEACSQTSMLVEEGRYISSSTEHIHHPLKGKKKDDWKVTCFRDKNNVTVKMERQSSCRLLIICSANQTVLWHSICIDLWKWFEVNFLTNLHRVFQVGLKCMVASKGAGLTVEPLV